MEIKTTLGTMKPPTALAMWQSSKRTSTAGVNVLGVLRGLRSKPLV
jgi:hypothetical protein